MKKVFQILAVVMAVLMSLLAVGCGEEEKKEAELLYFSSSDEGLDEFLNDFFRRHLRYNEDSIGGPNGLELGGSAMFCKEWDALSLMYFDATSTTVKNDRYEMMDHWLSDTIVDKYGYVWSHEYNLQPTMGSPSYYFGQGWPFPDYAQSFRNAKGWEFNTTETEEWTTNGSDLYTSNGLLCTDVREAEYVEFVSPDFYDTAVNYWHSPFLEIDLRLLSYTQQENIEDVYVYFKTVEENFWSEDKMVSQKSFSTRPVEQIPNLYLEWLFFPMYMHEKWADNDITQLKIVVKAKEGTTLDASVSLNYVRMNYDTRQSNNCVTLINGTKIYYEFTNDKAFLEKNLNRCRMAMQYMLSHLEGENGLIDMENLLGHDGVRGVGHGLGNGYWDILALPGKDAYSNLYFYNAVKSLAAMEKMAIEAGVDVAKPTIIGPDNVTVIPYEETAESLNALAATIRTEFTKEFWDDEKGRFFMGTNAIGEKIDYGFLLFNMEIATSDIASAEQINRIAAWANGDVTFEDENSTGEDLYYFEFAPRSTTIKNKKHYVWTWGGTNVFGDQVQDGGTVMYFSYYDLMMRVKALGADNAFERLKGIQAWYEKVKAAGGEGAEFYRVYYDGLLDFEFSLQGGSTAGGLGLDNEFLEAALMTSSIPFGFFGIGSDSVGEYKIAPELPSSLDFWKLENLTYSGLKFDVKVEKNAVTVSELRGDATGKTLKVAFDVPTGNYKVKVDGKAVETTVENGKVVAVVPFANCKITIE